jgi:hypothetical protein
MDNPLPTACCHVTCCNPAITCYHVAVELQYSGSGKMGHEISQFDIPDRQLLATSAQASMWSDIGEAKITHTIFGRARVRVIREKDKIIRAWLLAALAAIALAVAAWQGWIVLQQSKLFAVLPPLSERISVSAPIYQPETITPVAARSSGRSKPETLIQTEIDSLVASPNTLPQRPPGLNSTKPMVANPVTAQPLMANKPAPLATNNGSSMNQTNTQPHSKLPAPIQPAAPAVATPPATQPAANKPAPVITPGEPLSKKDTSAPSSAGNNQPPDTANVQAQANAQTQVNARGTAIIFVQPEDNAKP